jgi:hypothetical protein
MERVMGIEPTLAAWEAAVLPLNYTRSISAFPFPRPVIARYPVRGMLCPAPVIAHP